MKVALVSPYAWDTPGGVNAHVRSLAAQLRARGHEVRIIAPADGAVERGVVPVGRTIGIPFNGSVARLAFGPRVAARVRVALRRARPDVIHIHEPFSPSASLLALMAAKAPVVATFHAAIESRVYLASRRALGPWWRKIGAAIAVSDAACRTVDRIFGPGAAIIPNGVDVSAFDEVPPPDPDARSVLYFGRLERRKGPQVLAAALPSLFARVPDARVVFAGDGPMRRAVQDAIPPRFTDRVSLAGRFGDEDKPRILGGATVVCLPAIGGESFGITLLEALAAGRPVVATAIPGYAAVVRDGRDAVLVPPDDPETLAAALAEILRDREQIRRLAIAARQRAAAFDWPVVAGRIEAVYRQVAG